MPTMASANSTDADTPDDPASLHGRAAADLRYIRHAMERSATFTAVPGVGGAVMGALGLGGAAIAAVQPSAERWLLVWLTTAAVGFVVGLLAMKRKALRAGVTLRGAAGRRFAIGLAAPLCAGAALTGGLWLHDQWALMPAVWLLLYGTGVLVGGTFSVAPLRLLGVSFMTLGVAAILTPPSWGNLWLGTGFGGLQVAFGLYIARYHGG
jgi:hypothetical protein